MIYSVNLEYYIYKLYSTQKEHDRLSYCPLYESSLTISAYWSHKLYPKIDKHQNHKQKFLEKTILMLTKESTLFIFPVYFFVNHWIQLENQPLLECKHIH